MQLNELIDYMKERKAKTAELMAHAEADGNSDYDYYEGAYRTYEHLLSQLIGATDESDND